MSLKKVVLNPAFITFAITLPLFLFGINTTSQPDIAPYVGIFEKFSTATGPLAMTILGIKFSDLRLREYKDLHLYAVSFMKLIVCPLVAFCILLLLGTFMDTSGVRLNIIALSAMPVANNLMLFSSIYEKDVAAAARIVLLTTLISIVTIPIALTLLT